MIECCAPAWSRPIRSTPMEIIHPPDFQKTSELDISAPFQMSLSRRHRGSSTRITARFVQLQMKNYALLENTGELVIKGRRSSRVAWEPFQALVPGGMAAPQAGTGDREIRRCPKLAGASRSANGRFNGSAKTETCRTAVDLCGQNQGRRPRRNRLRTALRSGRDYRARPSVVLCHRRKERGRHSTQADVGVESQESRRRHNLLLGQA